MSTPLSARLLAGLHRGLLRGLVWLALAPLRAAVALLIWLGLVRAVASVAFVGWAQPVVGLRAAGWLVVIWWAHRLTRHQRARLYRHELLRRAERALGRRALALAGATPPQSHPPATTTPATRRPAPTPGRVAATPQPAADQPPEQTVAALGRYAAGWVRRHIPQANPDTPTRRRWRQRR